jgi:hypothetical protein
MQPQPHDVNRQGHPHPGAATLKKLSAIDSAEEQLLQLRGVQTGPTADVARRLLRGLSHSAGLIENAWKRTAVAAVNGGVPLEEVARWVDMPVEVFRDLLAPSRQEDGG